MSLKPSVSTDGGQTFNQNALAFATEAEALAFATDLFNRWLSCTDYRAVESDEPVNYTFKNGVLEIVGVAA